MNGRYCIVLFCKKTRLPWKLCSFHLCLQDRCFSLRPSLWLWLSLVVDCLPECHLTLQPAIVQMCKCANVQSYNYAVVHLCNCAIAHCDSDCSSHSSKVKSSSQLLLLLSSQLGILTINYQIALLQPNVNHKVHLSGSQQNSLNHLTPQSVTDTVSAVGPTLTECITVLVIPTPSTHILTHLPRTKCQRMVS